MRGECLCIYAAEIYDGWPVLNIYQNIQAMGLLPVILKTQKFQLQHKEFPSYLSSEVHPHLLYESRVKMGKYPFNA
jgi:hypothetical protein